MLVSVFFNVKILSNEAAWGMGFSNPYSSVFLSSFDGAVLLASLFFITKRKLTLNWKAIALPSLWIATLGFSLLWSTFEPLYSLLTLIKLWSLLLFIILLIHSKESVKIVDTVFYAIALQALLGILQFFTQSDFGLQILGEPILNESTAFLSKISLASQEWIRAYGTFPHPNIFGAVMGLALLLLGSSSFSSKVKIFLFTLFTLALIVSFSRSAALATIFALCFLSLKDGLGKMTSNQRISLVFFVPILSLSLFSKGFSFLSDPALIERAEGVKMALNLIGAHPLGLGFTAYTHALNEVALSPLSPWEYQPVHVVALLLIAEIGIPLFIMLGILTLFCFLKTRLTPEIVALLGFTFIIACFDHYFVSLEGGRMLLALMYAASWIKMEGKRHENLDALP